MVTIETQKKLMFIPFVNIANFFILVFNMNKSQVTPAGLIKAMISVLCYLLPVWFVLSVAARLLPDWYGFFSLCIMYFCPVAMSLGSIKFQVRYL